MTSVVPPGGPDGCVLDNGRVADDLSGCAGKLVSISLCHILFHSSPRPPGLGGAGTWLDTSTGSLWIGGSDCLTSVRPLLATGPNGCELDDGPATDVSAGFSGKWRSMRSRHILFHSSPRPPGLGGVGTWLDTSAGSLWIDGGDCLTFVRPPLATGPNGCELDDGRAADDFAGFSGKWRSMKSCHMLVHSSPRPPGLGSGWTWVETGTGTLWVGGSDCSTSVHL